MFEVLLRLIFPVWLLLIKLDLFMTFAGKWLPMQSYAIFCLWTLRQGISFSPVLNKYSVCEACCKVTPLWGQCSNVFNGIYSCMWWFMYVLEFCLLICLPKILFLLHMLQHTKMCWSLHGQPKRCAAKITCPNFKWKCIMRLISSSFIHVWGFLCTHYIFSSALWPFNSFPLNACTTCKEIMVSPSLARFLLAKPQMWLNHGVFYEKLPAAKQQS